MEEDYKSYNKKPERRKSRLYTTKIINNLYEDMGMGFVVDAEPFFPFDNELRNANVTFEMTPEEEEEWFKCSGDAEYFIEKYCKFMTDNGRRTVKLRDYQKRIINAVTSEHYDEGVDEFVPNNREVVLLASRQVGKCCNSLTISKLQNKSDLSNSKEYRFIDIFDKYKKDGGILHFIKRCLLKIYSKL